MYVASCPPPKDPNGKVIVFGMTALFLCNDGSVLVANCVAGSWKPNPPLC